MANKTIDQLTTASTLANDDYLPVETQSGTRKATADTVSNAGQIAPNFDATATYSVGNLVFYERTLYRCTTAITTAGAWDSTKWTGTTVKAELARLETELATIVPVSKGGTGATDASTARTNLGLGTAATASSTTSISSGGAGLPTSGTVYSYTHPVVITSSSSSAPSNTRALWVYPAS